MAAGDRIPARDPDGFLLDHQQWNELVAEQLAQEESIELTDRHWEVLILIRRYYAEFDSSPAMRALVKYIRIHLGADRASSIYLLSLFPGSPAKLAAKLAGLPKPANCL